MSVLARGDFEEKREERRKRMMDVEERLVETCDPS
jgi:hypothetical protein